MRISSGKTGFLTVFLVISMLASPLFAQQANASTSTVNCSSGSFTIVENIVTGHTNCQGLAVIPEGVTKIDDWAFWNSSITDVTLPGTLTSIGKGAFFGTGLVAVDFPNSVTAIGDQALFGTDLVSINIPNSVLTIGRENFNDTSSLINISVGSGNENYSSESGVLFNKDKTVLIRYPQAKTDTSYTIPNGVAIIEPLAFADNQVVTSVVIPSSVVSVGSYTFTGTQELKSVTFANSSKLLTIGQAAFANASGLSTINIPDSVDTIGSQAFYNTPLLTSVTFGPSSKLKTIGFQAFAQPDLGGLRGITSINIPSGVTSIGAQAFLLATSLNTVILPSSLLSIGDQAFAGTGIQAMNFPNGVTTIGEYAFENVTSLTTVNLPASLRSIGNGAFQSAGITTLALPESVTSIGQNAFYNTQFLSYFSFCGDANLLSDVGLNGKTQTCAVGVELNSKVVTIPSGATQAILAATDTLPALKLSFSGIAPSSVTVLPLADNPAPSSATPFVITGTTKIVDIQITDSFTGSATICLDGDSTDRLYHFTGGAWVELSTQTYVSGQVCGVTTSFSPFVAAPVYVAPTPVAPVYVAPTPVPYLKTLTFPKLNLKDSKLVCTPGTYNSGYTLEGVIQGGTTANFSPTNYVYNLLINGVTQSSLAIISTAPKASWDLSALSTGGLISCSVTVSVNALINTDKSTDESGFVFSAQTVRAQEITAAESQYSEILSANSKAYQKALVDNRAIWRKEIEAISTTYSESLVRIKAKGGPKMGADRSAALKIRIADQKKSAAQYAASKPAALAAKEASNKSALDEKAEAMSRSNLKYGTFIESIGYGVLVP